MTVDYYEKTTTVTPGRYPWSSPTITTKWSDKLTMTSPIIVNKYGNYYEIKNFCNLGTALEDTTPDGVTIESDFSFYFDEVNGEATFDAPGKLMGKWFDMASENTSGYSGIRFLYSVVGYDHATGKTTPSVKAQMKEATDMKPYHNSAPHGWVTNGGRRRTYEGSIMSLGGFALYNDGAAKQQAGFDNLYGPRYYSGADISLEKDVTLDVEMSVDRFGYEEEIGVLVEGVMKVNKNDQHVKGYELWMLPGFHDSVNNKSEFNHTHQGHTNGFCIDAYSYGVELLGESTNAPRRAKALTDGEPFSKLIPMDEIPEASRDPEGHYSVYVKAIYGDDKNLTPTYHALSYNSIVTGVDATNADLGQNVSVTTNGGEIIVNGATLPVEIFTPEGVMVYSGIDTNIAVANGLYIVRTGSTVAKVLVK